MNDDNKRIIKKLSNFAFISTFIGVCTIGICPAFSVIGLTIDLVLRKNNIELEDDCRHKMKGVRILGISALVMFVADIAAAYFLFVK